MIYNVINDNREGYSMTIQEHEEYAIIKFTAKFRKLKPKDKSKLGLIMKGVNLLNGKEKEKQEKR